MYKRILVAVDGSDNSLRAAQKTAELVSALGDVEVELVSVIAIDVYSDMVYDPIEAHGDAQREIILPAVEVLKEVGVEPGVTILHGRPADEVIRYAEESEADLLVIGSRGLNALQKLALGSVSNRIVVHAKCPVLVVK